MEESDTTEEMCIGKFNIRNSWPQLKGSRQGDSSLLELREFYRKASLERPPTSEGKVQFYLELRGQEQAEI